MQTLIVDKKHDGKKLNKLLLDTFPSLSMNSFYKALRKKDIRVDNIRVNEDITVYMGNKVDIFITDDILYRKPKIKIIYEDENILVVDKPNGIEVAGNHSLTELLLPSYPFISPCHRIDMNTTGLVLFAKNEETLKILLKKFQNHEIEKHYLATVYGIPKKKSATLTAYLFKDRKKSMVYISDIPEKGYIKIITSYVVISKNSNNNTSILDVELLTGKTHQIRAHLAHIGYPIIGDGKYGINSINKEFKAKTQMLSSYSLKFKFTTPSGILEYLNGKKITLDTIKP